ncbi:MAG: 50S ribosomal protein L11 methyltransferase [Verrucomicrobiaceae bacterium]|nr:50S ribosomal protein L11 methyltransferase [Verrucomicrobiaceae bacterium]
MHVWSKLSPVRWADAWMERLGGFHGVQVVITEVPGRKTVRVEAFCESAQDAKAIAAAFGGTVRPVKHQNWAAMAPEPSEPILIRKSLVVVDADTPKKIASMAKMHPNREVVAVPPELAFGTGHHATTETVLGFVADEATEHQRAGTGWTVCDLGCGSGILGIAARKLGAKKVWGCDFDPLAIKVAKANIIRNGVDKTKFVQADVLKWEPKEKWDMVLANIFFDVLMQAFPTIVKALKPGGTLVVSGILKSYADECLAAAEEVGIEWTKKVTKKNKWVSAKGRLKE